MEKGRRTVSQRNRGVVAENSVQSEKTEVPIIREIMVATTMSSVFVALFALVASSFQTPCGLADGDPRPSSLTDGFPKELPASLAPPPRRPAVVGCVVSILVRLAAMSADGSA